MKKRKILFLSILFVVLCSALIMGCSSGQRVIPEDYKAAGYRKVLFYYNGGTEGDGEYREYYLKAGGRLPLPGRAGQSDIKNPIRQGYDFYSWFAIKPEYLGSRQQLLYEQVKDEYGKLIDGEPLQDIRGNHASILVYFIEGHDFLLKGSKEQSLSLKDYEDEIRIDEETGTPVKPESERLFIKEWNFDFDKVDDDVVLVAIWRPLRQYVIVPPENKNDNFDAEDYDNLTLYDINANGEINIESMNARAPKKLGSQVENFYLDPGCKNTVPFVNNKYYPPSEFIEESNKFKVFPIYISWLPEKFTKVSSASALTSLSSGTSYYIMSDLDFKGLNFSTPEVYRGEIRGNNHVWRNISITVNEGILKGATSYGGIFKSLMGAKIQDIIFENLTITFKRMDPDMVRNDLDHWKKAYSVNLFANSIDDRSVIRNVKIGNPDNPAEKSTYTLVDYSSFGAFSDIVVLDESGHEIRYTESHGKIHYDTQKYGENGWPKEGDVYTSELLSQDEEGNLYLVELPIKYARDYRGNIRVEVESHVDRVDLKTLYGYTTYSAPEVIYETKIVEGKEEIVETAVYPITFNQKGSNFGLTSQNIIDCQSDMTYVDTDIEWETTYNGGAPLPDLKDMTINRNQYKFAGWYTSAYAKWDFSVIPPQEGVHLRAMWKLA